MFADSCGTSGDSQYKHCCARNKSSEGLAGVKDRTEGHAQPRGTHVSTRSQRQAEPHVNLCEPIPRDRSKCECEDRRPTRLTNQRTCLGKPWRGGARRPGDAQSLGGWAPSERRTVSVSGITSRCHSRRGTDLRNRAEREVEVEGEERKGEERRRGSARRGGGAPRGVKGLPQRCGPSLALNRFPFPKPSEEEFILSSP